MSHKIPHENAGRNENINCWLNQTPRSFIRTVVCSESAEEVFRDLNIIPSVNREKELDFYRKSWKELLFFMSVIEKHFIRKV